jgi:multidrug resistance efflux pump
MKPKLGKLVRRIPVIIVGIISIFVFIFFLLSLFLKAEVSVRVEGTIFPADYTIVRPEIMATVKEICVRENEWVEEGQLLAKLQDAQKIASVDMAEAELSFALAERSQVQKALALKSPQIGGGKMVAPAAARLDMARRNLKLQEELYEKKVISLKSLRMAEYEEALAEMYANLELNEIQLLTDQLITTNAFVRKAQINLVSQQRYLELTNIYAPISSRVLTAKPHTLEGQFIQVGEPLLRLGNVKDMTVEVRIPEEDIAFLEVGQKARIFVKALPYSEYKVFKGKLAKISPYYTTEEEASKQTRTKTDAYTVGKIEIEDPKCEREGKTYYLMPGMSAEVDIIAKQNNIFRLLLHKLRKGERSISKVTVHF